jgi:hypothetical protein
MSGLNKSGSTNEGHRTQSTKTDACRRRNGRKSGKPHAQRIQPLGAAEAY